MRAVASSPNTLVIAAKLAPAMMELVILLARNLLQHLVKQRPKEFNICCVLILGLHYSKRDLLSE